MLSDSRESSGAMVQLLLKPTYQPSAQYAPQKAQRQIPQVEKQTLPPRQQKSNRSCCPRFRIHPRHILRTQPLLQSRIHIIGYFRT